jgi:PAS domain S-box-containing protein
VRRPGSITSGRRQADNSLGSPELLSALLRRLGLLVLTALGYFLLARLGYTYVIRPAGIAIWPPAGFLLALFILTDTADWPVVLAGALVGNVTADLSNGASTVIAAAGGAVNSLESLLAAWVVLRLVRRPVTLRTLRHVTVLAVAAAGVSNAGTALLGALVLTHLSLTNFGHAWFVWWTGDGLGMLLVAPVVLTWVDVARTRTRPTRGRVMETVVGFFVILVAAQYVLSRAPNPGGTLSTDPYMLVPVLLWVALRLGPAGAATATLLLSVVTVWNSARAVGPFAEAGLSGTNEILQVYAYLALASLSTLIPAAILSEREAAEVEAAERARQAARLAAILDAAVDFVTIGRPDGAPLYVNPAARRAFGVGPAEPIASLLEFRPPGFGTFLHETVLPATIRDGSWRGETEYITRSGARIPVSQVWVVHLGADGQTILSSISRDISERLRMEESLRVAEARMRFALEASGVGVWEADLQTGATYWSATCERIHGLAAGTFGGSFDAFLARIRADERPRIARIIELATRDHADSEFTYHTVWPDGTVRIIATTGRTFFDENGTPLRAAGVAVDVTDRQALEDQLRQAQKMEAVGQLASGVAHDFNNMLTAILGYAQLLQNDPVPDDERRAAAREIEGAGRRAAEITQQLLAFGRRQVLQPRVTTLSQVIGGLLPMLQRLLGEHILITVDEAHDDREILADVTQLEQVIINLAVNARDAMPDGGRLTLRARGVDLDEAYAASHVDVAPGRYAALEVTDTGHGMDADTQARIFDPFFTTKGVGRGTGLGLSTVHGIVAQMRGHIWVYSEPRVGTTFRLYFPQCQAAARRPDAPSRTAAAATIDGHETILVVEDDASIRSLVSRILGQRGYRVLTAADPADAAAVIDGHAASIDLLLTDMRMPGGTAADVLRLLRDQQPDLAVLFMSGYADLGRQVEGVPIDEAHFLAKPFTGMELAARIRRVLDERTDGGSDEVMKS